MNWLKKHSPLLLIMLVGALLRLYRLADVPPSLNWDEVSHGYNAFSILKTGADEWGIRFPTIFRAYGDYKLPLYIYLTTLPVWLFGLTAFSVRFISALAGILAIPGLYLLANQLFPQKIALRLKHCSFDLTPGHLAAVVLAFLPWHFFISRPALEANLALTFFIYGLYFLLKGFTTPRLLPFAALTLGASLHTYNSYRVITPLVLVATLLLHRPKLKLSRPLLISLAIFIAALGLVVYQVISGSGVARYQKLNIISENAVYQIGQKRLASQLPQPLPRLLYNRPVYFARTVFFNYLGYFSPWFLYQVDGAQYQFALPGKNMLTLPVYILALAGLFLCLLRFKKTAYSQVTLLLLLAPVAAALTVDPPQALRPTPMIVPIVLLAVLGLHQLYTLVAVSFKNRFSPVFLSLYLLAILIFAFSRYAYDYFTDYSPRYAYAWQYGYAQMIDYVQKNASNYERVFITKRLGEPHEFYAFYTQLDPRQLQSSEHSTRFFQSDWYWTDRIGNVYFVNDWEIPHQQSVSTLTLESKTQVPTQNSLLITSVLHQPSNAQLLETIKLPDDTPVFVISKF